MNRLGNLHTDILTSKMPESDQRRSQCIDHPQNHEITIQGSIRNDRGSIGIFEGRNIFEPLSLAADIFNDVKEIKESGKTQAKP